MKNIDDVQKDKIVDRILADLEKQGITFEKVTGENGISKGDKRIE